MHMKKKLYDSKKLARNAVLNAAKQILVIIFPFVTTPYISRVLGPGNYGDYNFSMSIVNYFSLIAGLGYYPYAIREGARIRDEKEEFKSFCNNIFTLNLLSTFIAYMLLLLSVFFLPKLNLYRNLILILSLSFGFTCLGVDWINVIYEDYFYLTIRYLIVEIISLVMIFVLVRTSGDNIKYAWITVFSFVVTNLLNFFHVRKYTKLKVVLNKKIFIHLSSVLILFANSVATIIYANSDITMLGFFRDSYEVGVYGLSSKIYSGVKSVIAAVVVVTLPQLSAWVGNKEKEQYDKLLDKLIEKFLLIMIPASIGLFLLSKEVIYIVGGNEYAEGYKSLLILCIAIVVSMISYFLWSTILMPNKKEKNFLVGTIMSAAFNIFANFYFIPKYGYNGAAITTVCSELIVLTCCIINSKKISSLKISRNIILILGVSVFCLFLLNFFVRVLFKNTWAIVGSLVISFMVIYYYLLLAFGFPVKDLIRNLSSNK